MFGRATLGSGALLPSGPSMGPDRLPRTLLWLRASNPDGLPQLSSSDPPSSSSVEFLPWPSLWPGSLLAIGGLLMLSHSPLGDPSKVPLSSICPVLSGSGLRLRAGFWLDWALAGAQSSGLQQTKGAKEVPGTFWLVGTFWLAGLFWVARVLLQSCYFGRPKLESNYTKEYISFKIK